MLRRKDDQALPLSLVSYRQVLLVGWWQVKFARRSLLQNGCEMKLRFAVSMLILACPGFCAAQAACFRSVAEAVAQSGRPGTIGFWLEGTMRDAMNGEKWAQIGRCGHPEWPALRVKASAPEFAMVATVRPTPSGGPGYALGQPTRTATRDPLLPVLVAVRAEQGEPIVRAGATVTVMQHSALVRLEVSGVALASAAVGDQVKVRVGSQQFVVGTVRSDGRVEIP